MKIKTGIFNDLKSQADRMVDTTAEVAEANARDWFLNNGIEADPGDIAEALDVFARGGTFEFVPTREANCDNCGALFTVTDLLEDDDAAVCGACVFSFERLLGTSEYTRWAARGRQVESIDAMREERNFADALGLGHPIVDDCLAANLEES